MIDTLVCQQPEMVTSGKAQGVEIRGDSFTKNVENSPLRPSMALPLVFHIV